MSLEKPAVVIDNGSRFTKAGFACDNHPVSMFRTLVGRPAYLKGKYGRSGFYDVLIGDETVSRIVEYDVMSPIENGKIVHWDNMERIWHHIYYKELKVAPEERPVVLTCSPTSTVAEKVHCCQVFFEVLNAPAITVQPLNVLALYGSGISTGVNVDMGYDSTNICPTYEGRFFAYGLENTGIAGKQIFELLQEYMTARNIDLGPQAADLADDIMKRYLYVTPNIAMSRKDYKRMYKLPNGIEVDIGQEAFMTGEYLFNPDFIAGKETGRLSLCDAFISSCLKCDAELRAEMYNGVVLTGGLSMIPGLRHRLKADLEERLKKPVNVLASSESYAVAWLGGATLAGVSDITKILVTKKQYEDYGAKIISNKFL